VEGKAYLEGIGRGCEEKDVGPSKPGTLLGGANSFHTTHYNLGGNTPLIFGEG